MRYTSNSLKTCQRICQHSSQWFGYILTFWGRLAGLMCLVYQSCLALEALQVFNVAKSSNAIG